MSESEEAVMPTIKREYPCKECGQVLHSKSAYHLHKKVKHSDAPLRYQCEFCGKYFQLKMSYETHLRIHTKEKPYKCSLCEMCFTTAGYLVIHEKRHKNIKDCKCEFPGCGKSFVDTLSLNRHKAKHSTERRYKCDECGAKFKTSSTKSQHMKIHRSYRLHCDLCGKAFVHSHALEIHKASHSGIKPHNCLDCNKAFATQHGLKKHWDSNHSEDPSALLLQCDICLKRFHSKYYLKCHIEKHVKTADFFCPIDDCVRSFYTDKQLQEHIISHSEQYICYICAKVVTSQGSLNKHLKLHERELFECSLCNGNFKKSFKSKESLEAHMRFKHLGDDSGRPVCDFCGKNFFSAKTLEFHRQLHNDNKHLKCALCPEFFKVPRQRKSHHFKFHRGIDYKATYKRKKAKTYIEKIALKDFEKVKETINPEKLPKEPEKLPETPDKNTDIRYELGSSFKSVIRKRKLEMENVTTQLLAICDNTNSFNEVFIKEEPFDQILNDAPVHQVDLFDIFKEEEIEVKPEIAEFNKELVIEEKPEEGEIYDNLEFLEHEFESDYSDSLEEDNQPLIQIKHAVTNEENNIAKQEIYASDKVQAWAIDLKKTNYRKRIGKPCKYCKTVRRFNSEIGLNFHLYIKHREIYMKGKTEDDPEVKLLKEKQIHLERRSQFTEEERKANLTCNICNELFEKEESLNAHAKQLHPKMKAFKCPQCPTVFGGRSARLSHYRRAHIKELQDTENEALKCDLCDRMFITHVDFLNHKKYHERRERFHCKYCDKKFINEFSINRHMEMHNKNFTYICDICGKGFNVKSSLETHHLVHSDEKPYHCQYCPMKFKTPIYLKSHMRVHKPPKENYTCEICSKSYTSKQYLQIHLNIHAGIRKYKCNQCDKAFFESKALIQHRRNEHDSDRDFRTFDCDQCGQQFKSQSSLYVHKMVHRTENNSFNCKACNKRYTAYAGLNYHLRNNPQCFEIHNAKKQIEKNAKRKIIEENIDNVVCS